MCPIIYLSLHAPDYLPVPTRALHAPDYLPVPTRARLFTCPYTRLAKLTPAPAATLTPNDFLAQGRALRQQNHLQEAINLYLEALALFPADPDLLNDFGVTLGRVGLHDAALAQFEAALAIDPDHALARQNKAAAEAALH